VRGQIRREYWRQGRMICTHTLEGGDDRSREGVGDGDREARRRGGEEARSTEEVKIVTFFGCRHIHIHRSVTV
jgi:hypothetical protein